MLSVPRLIVSAVRGGLGKTTVALGIIAAWRSRGRRVASFKKGPDFIDAGWLGAAAGTPCYNLDLFLMQENFLLRSFASHAAGRDAAVVEGNRGLHDGIDESGTFSTARLAKLLQAPVALIVDCTKSSGTVAAVVLGCKQLDPSVQIGGVILNNISSARHEAVIRKAVEHHVGIPVIGAIPRLRKGEFPERHMGLTPFQEHPDVAGAVASAASVAERYLDLDALWRMAAASPEMNTTTDTPQEAIAGPRVESDQPVIGVIRDRAFQFYYPENLEALRSEGAVLRELNALQDPDIPAIDALYIGGGFPETHAAELAANRSFCRSLKDAVEHDLPVYAECGGLIYLGRSLSMGTARYPMTAVLPADFSLESRPQAHGYTVLEVTGPNPFFDTGSVLKGHEFHYSRITNCDELPGMIFSMQRGHGITGTGDGILYRNVLATYTHLHAGGTPGWAAGFIRAARRHRERSRQRVA